MRPHPENPRRTQGAPGWTNQNSWDPSLFDWFESRSGIGGVLVRFSDPFDRYGAPPEPAGEDAIDWTAVHRQGVGEAALALAKRPRERLILPLTLRLHPSPSELNGLNLAQDTRKNWEGCSV